MSQPYVCPVCGGRGAVPAEFYSSGGDTQAVPCRSCHGTGIVWSPQVATAREQVHTVHGFSFGVREGG